MMTAGEYAKPDSRYGYTPLGTGDEQLAWIKPFEELYKFHLDQLSSPYQDFLRWWRLYLAKQEDRRSPEERKWRANVFVPYPYSGIETKTAALTDIMNSADPLIQAEGVGEEDLVNRDPIERLLDYTLTRNLWRSKSDSFLREAAIQGTMAFKTIYLRRATKLELTPTSREIVDFGMALAEAIRATGILPEAVPSPVQDPAGFERWRLLVNQSGRAKLPPVPGGQKHVMVKFQGPWADRCSMFDLAFDPTEANWQEQEQVVHRVVRPDDWIDERTGTDDRFAFDPAAVEAARGKNGSGDGNILHETDREIARLLGISAQTEQNPRYRCSSELLEVFRPNARDGVRYAIVMNRQRVINKRPDRMPYLHDQIPITLVRNVPIPGKALGMSELAQPEALYYELNALRNLRLDAVTMAVLPIFLRMKEVGLPELRRLIKPGAVWDVSRADGIQQLTKGGVPAEIFREIFDIKTDIDETNSTPSQLRGSPSTVGRVSATESQSRFSQALVRMKQAVSRVEDELSPFVHQCLAIWAQYADSGLRVKIAGKDPFLEISREDLLESIHRDYRFRGATRAINRDMQLQQMLQYAQQFGVNLAPVEMRRLMVTIWETMGLKNANQIITEKVTAIAQKKWEMQQGIETAKLQQMGGQAGQPGTPQAPPEGMLEGEPQATGGEGPQVAMSVPQRDVGEEVVNSLREGDAVGASSGMAPGQGAPPGTAPPGQIGADGSVA